MYLLLIDLCLFMVVYDPYERSLLQNLIVMLRVSSFRLKINAVQCNEGCQLLTTTE